MFELLEFKRICNRILKRRGAGKLLLDVIWLQWVFKNDIHLKKKWTLSLTGHNMLGNQLEMDSRIKIKGNAIKLLEIIAGQNPHNWDFHKFLKQDTQKSLIIKQKIDRLNSTRLENFCLLKDTFKRFKRQFSKEEKILVINIHPEKNWYSINPTN